MTASSYAAINEFSFSKLSIWLISLFSYRYDSLDVSRSHVFTRQFCVYIEPKCDN